MSWVRVLPEAAHFFSREKELFLGVVALHCFASTADVLMYMCIAYYFG